MFCPICKAEYREGFQKCSDCDAQLVEQLPPESPESKIEFIDYKEVLSTFNPMDIALIKSLLDSENIIYYFQGEHFLYMRPLALPARLMVETEQVTKAREILRDLKLSFTGINLRKD